MAFRNSEPLAHTHAAERTPPVAHSSPVLPPSSSAAPPPLGAPIGAPTAASYQATQQAPPTHPLEYTPQNHYQLPSHQGSPPLQAEVFAAGQQHAQGPAMAHDLFARPPQAATPGADPLSHLLRDGMQMERHDTPPATGGQDAGRTQASTTGVQYGRQPVVARTQAPPASPEPTLVWGPPVTTATGGGAGGNRDGFRERVGIRAFVCVPVVCLVLCLV